MPSKLSRYAEGVMEATWLAALIVVPVFFNVYSSRIFEPDKLTLLRTLVLVLLGAWIVKLIDEGGVRWERMPQDGSILQALGRIPLFIPIVALAAIYVLATVFSVAPRISLWGSYQRLQGTYTTLSYLVVFAAIVVNLRRRAQVERLITTAILASLPVSLYGVLQRYEIDPVPWGGNVARRIASNMGNSIFVAAYLIMASPLTIGRIVDSFGAILKDTEDVAAHVVRSTIYVFIAALQLIAIYLSGSRGPLLGWLAGSFFLFVLLSLHWRKRWMTVAIVGVAVAVSGFLVLLNVPNGPLETLRDSPWIGRFGKVFDTDQRTSRVRILIWQGASELFFPHDPLEYPDGTTDNWNFLRPVIGYGPESMHVAYNPFFPPELADIEKRNASPDRSHNETWDALVTTGALGLVVYLFLFGSVFYYGLKWLGLVSSARQRNLFLIFCIGGGALGAVVLVDWQGVGFFGVGLPFGIVLGLIAYLTVISLAARYEPPQTAGGSARALTLMMLLAAIVAHFVEIHFGIAIAATRTYFWVYTGLLLVVGAILPLHGEYGSEAAVEAEDRETLAKPARNQRSRPARRRRKRGDRVAPSFQLGEYRNGLVNATVLGVLLITLGYDFINVQSGADSALGAIWNSFTRLPNKNGAVSYGVLTMMLTVWLAAGLVFASEHGSFKGKLNLRDIGITLGYSSLVAVLFWLWHGASLVAIAKNTVTTQAELMVHVAQFEGLLTRYYVYLLLLVFLLALLVPADWPLRGMGRTAVSWLAAPAILILALSVGYSTNIKVIQADIAYKLADPFTKSGQWDAAIGVYQQATSYAPAEDFYYLFLGKAQLESAQALQNASRQDQQVKEAEKTLLHAQDLNPLNTDHTANLARLYRWWSSRAGEAGTRKERAQISSDYYERALALSPNNVGLWGEWASLYLTSLNQPEEAYDRLNLALELDPTYEVTHGLLGDYYVITSRRTEDPQAREAALQAAAVQYNEAIEASGARTSQALYNYRVALAGVYIELGELQNAILTYQAALSAPPRGAELWKIQETIASLYAQIGDTEQAIAYASGALQSAPDNQKARLQNLISQLQSLTP